MVISVLVDLIGFSELLANEDCANFSDARNVCAAARSVARPLAR